MLYYIIEFIFRYYSISEIVFIWIAKEYSYYEADKILWYPLGVRFLQIIVNLAYIYSTPLFLQKRAKHGKWAQVFRFILSKCFCKHITATLFGILLNAMVQLQE